MANPNPYTPSYSFSGWQTSNPAKPLPAPQVDNEFANISTSLNAAITGLTDVRRSDGQLKNGIVTVESLSPSLNIGFTLRGAWASGQHYLAADGVVYNSNFYRALVTHDATNANRPDLSPTTWQLLFSIAAISGAMSAFVYDPNNHMADAFDRANHTGTQAISTVVNLQSSLDLKLSISAFSTNLTTSLPGVLNAASTKNALADADKMPLLDSADSYSLKAYTLADLINSVFTTTRTITNAWFAAASFRLRGPSSAVYQLFDASPLTANRTLKLANRDTDLARLGMELLAETIVSTPVPAVDFPNVLSSAFDQYFIELTDVSPSVASILYMRMSIDGGANWLTSGYSYSSVVSLDSGATGAQISGAAFFAISSTSMLPTNASLCASMTIHRSTARRNYEMKSFFNANNGSSLVSLIGGTISQTADSIRFLSSSGNIVSGRFRIYGIRKG
ncbi:hypothetical protein ELH51_27330 [Rhizobium ruizarguesonis]|uniref:hypothetical protein n=1 Tax=Rhizobium ruizarguesonis TaxID=2081791 RepID=UPI0010323862|nr:hypothetical protein [Rhizobium ruizarguesonis]TBB25196.1 hypothetical protein ELH51_27330 [Rhizobium ruizarguesonis]